MKIAWWDVQWHSNEPKCSWGHREVMQQLVRSGVEIERIGSPRTIGREKEDPFFAAMRHNEAVERDFISELFQMCHQWDHGPGGIEICLEETAKMCARYNSSWIAERYQAVFILSNPIAFLRPKMQMVSMFLRAAKSGLPVIIYDNDVQARATLDYCGRAIEKDAESCEELSRVEVWAPHSDRNWPRWRFMFWPYNSAAERDPVTAPDYDLGYIGNGWAANGPNYPHAERLFIPGADQRYAVWGDWDENKRPYADKIDYFKGVPRNTVEETYSKRCLATIFMMHGRKRTPHLTPRNNEVLQAGIPLLWDSTIKSAKNDVTQFAPWLLPELAVNDHIELSEKLRGLRKTPSLRRAVVACQREARKKTASATIQPWTERLEVLCG